MSSLIRVLVVSAVGWMWFSAASPVAAQETTTIPVPVVEVTAGYTFMRDFSVDDELAVLPDHIDFPAGWAFSTAFNATHWLGLVGEVTGSYRNRLNVSLGGLNTSNKARVYTFMAGPRFFKKVGRVAPFVQVLAGAAHMRLKTTVPDVSGIGPFSEEATDFAVQPGGGVTVFLTENVGVRLAGDYRCIVDFAKGEENTYSNEFRTVAGFTFNWGAR